MSAWDMDTQAGTCVDSLSRIAADLHKKGDVDGLERIDAALRDLVAEIAAYTARAPLATRATHATPHSEARREPDKKQVKVASGLSLEAVVLTGDPTQTTLPPGELCYMVDSGQFAFSIGGHCFYGNVGDVLPPGARPVKVKECKRGEWCDRLGCGYYHCPARGGARGERRNFRAGGAVFGAERDHLAAALGTITGAAARQHRDRAVHDVLTALLVEACGGLRRA